MCDSNPLHSQSGGPTGQSHHSSVVVFVLFGQLFGSEECHLEHLPRFSEFISSEFHSMDTVQSNGCDGESLVLRYFFSLLFFSLRGRSLSLSCRSIDKEFHVHFGTVRLEPADRIVAFRSGVFLCQRTESECPQLRRQSGAVQWLLFDFTNKWHDDDLIYGVLSQLVGCRRDQRLFSLPSVDLLSLRSSDEENRLN